MKFSKENSRSQLEAPTKICHTSPQIFENLFTYKQAAQYLSVSEPYLRKLKAQGVIPYVQIGRAIRFHPRSLAKWVKEREIK